LKSSLSEVYFPDTHFSGTIFYMDVIILAIHHRTTNPAFKKYRNARFIESSWY